MKNLINEFKEFISRGNVVDMAVGVIIATAFGKITTSLINDVIMPFIAWVTGSRDMTALNILVRPENTNTNRSPFFAIPTAVRGCFTSA